MSSKTQGKTKNMNCMTKEPTAGLTLRAFVTKESALPVVGRAPFLGG